MARPPKVLKTSIELFESRRLDYERLCKRVRDICQEVVGSTSLSANIRWRVKDPESLRAKIADRLKRGEVAQKDMPAQVLAKVNDLAGLRILTYIEADRDRVVQMLEERFESTVHTERKDSNERQYRATHCVVTLPASESAGDVAIEGLHCEIQVCSMLGHVWNELEHDLVYKPYKGTVDPEAKRLFEVLGKLLDAGDGLINEVMHLINRRAAANEGPLKDAQLFSYVMGEDFRSAAPAFERHSEQAHDACLKLKLDTKAKIRNAVGWVESQPAAMRMVAEALAACRLPSPAGRGGQGVLKVDPDSADLLLLLLISNDILRKKLKRLYGRESGQGRPRRILSMIRAYEELPAAQRPVPPRNPRLAAVPRKRQKPGNKASTL